MIIAKYKYDSSVYADFVPVFNDGYPGYTISDVVDGNIVTRTIECDTLPTLMKFGVKSTNETDNTGRQTCILEVDCINIENVTDMSYMFNLCENLTKVNTEGWDTSNVTTMSYMFDGCFSLTQLDVSNFDTGNVTNMNRMFCNCRSLTSLDVSNFDTSNVTNMYRMFYDCNNLTSLDVSNFNTTNVTDMGNIFTNTPLLTDIGMVYCNPSTVSKLSSVLNTQVRNVYVECDPLCYDKYQYITYMQYKEDKKTLLYLDDETNTWKKPVLREWDSIEKHSDGKYYYSKRSGEVVLNGSEHWATGGFINDKTISFNHIVNLANIYKGNLICDKFQGNTSYSSSDDFEYIANGSANKIFINILKSKLSTQDVAGFKAWLKANPTTVVYQLAEEKIYECISLDIMSHFNTTNLEINSGVIIPKTTLRLQESVPNVVRELQEKVSMLENELVLLKIDKMLSDIQDIINE